jgi:hypothetical protein
MTFAKLYFAGLVGRLDMASSPTTNHDDDVNPVLHFDSTLFLHFYLALMHPFSPSFALISYTLSPFVSLRCITARRFVPMPSIPFFCMALDPKASTKNASSLQLLALALG